VAQEIKTIPQRNTRLFNTKIICLGRRSGTNRSSGSIVIFAKLSPKKEYSFSNGMAITGNTTSIHRFDAAGIDLRTKGRSAARDVALLMTINLEFF
jgi:hypothetical protein